MMTKKKLNKVSNSTRFGSCLQLNNNNSNNNDNNKLKSRYHKFKS